MASEQSEVDRAFLSRIPIFAGLPDRVMELIADTLRVVHVVPGAQLLREGEHARSMFVVREGELQILKRGRDGTEYKLAVLKTGDGRQATLYVLDLAEIGKLYKDDVEADALLVLDSSGEISRRLRVADDVV